MVVVTGGTKGIGKAIIEEFAANGHDIVTCARNLNDLKDLQTEIYEKYKVKLHYQQINLANRKEIEDFARFIKRSIARPVDVLVNNAGIFIPSPIHQEKDGMFELTMKTNVFSAYYLSKELLGTFIERKKGHIFNVCSVASIKGFDNGGSYVISKFALYGLSQSLREELKPYGVKVTSVLPGATFTASWAGSNVSPDRLMKAQDVAKMILASYQLSENSVVEEILIRPQLGDL